MIIIEVTTKGQRSPVGLMNGQLITFSSKEDYFTFKATVAGNPGVQFINWNCTPEQRRLVEPHYVPAPVKTEE